MQSGPMNEISQMGPKLLVLAIHQRNICHQSHLYGITGLLQEQEEGTYCGDEIQCWPPTQ